MTSLSRDLVFLMLQCLDEDGFKETVHKLEKESGYYFNMNYFEDLIINGEWDRVEEYLSGFTKVHDNRHSLQIFFEIRKQKYLETLDNHDYNNAMEVLRKDLKGFACLNENQFNEFALLLTLKNFREYAKFSHYGDTKSSRSMMLADLKMLIEENPLFRDKLQFPNLENSRLRTLINQALNLQHQHCKFPNPNLKILTLFTDHKCEQPPSSSSADQPRDSMPNIGGFPPLGGVSPQQFQPGPAPLTTSLGGGIANPIDLDAPNNAASQNHGQTSSYSCDDLPKTVVADLNHGSARNATAKSMDFHPLQQTLLLVGTSIGDIALWDVISRNMVSFSHFKVWDLGACSTTLQESLADEYSASVNRVRWSPDGSLLGVAFSKHLLHLYSFHSDGLGRPYLEIDAHTGNVNDIGFSHPNGHLCIITCGDDKALKVWDAILGTKVYTFEGHQAPVYSICPQQRGSIQFVYSASVDGKMKAWFYDNMGSRVDFDAPGGQSCIMMASSSDRTRLFSCGTSEAIGKSHMVEWNETEGSVKRNYLGLERQSIEIVQFDTTKNRFLVTAERSVIKFWHMDDVNLLTITDADGELPASPCIRFNKEGTLLAVSTSHNSVKILANAEGIQLVRGNDNYAPGAYIASSSSARRNINGVTERDAPRPTLPAVSPMITNETWKMTEIDNPTQLRVLRLPDASLPVTIISLRYTNSGGAILALAYNAVYKFWKWQKNEWNLKGKATTNRVPQICQDLITNDDNLEDGVPCFALSKNDNYLVSASGGEVSLFSMTMFRTLTTIWSPPPIATCLALHPLDNNILAIGMEDSSIHILYTIFDEVKSELTGHQKMVTGLAFSNVLNILVSSGADAQLCVWSMDGWEKQASKFLQIPSGRAPSSLTRIQFHQDQIQLLVIHEIQLAVYKAPNLECIKRWVPRVEENEAITGATYSCDSQSIYATFEDGTIAVLTATTFRVRCLIRHSAYLPYYLSPGVHHPLAIVAHPIEPNQFALGLINGGVYVLEPPESEGEWGTMPPNENGAGPSTVYVASGSDQQ